MTGREAWYEAPAEKPRLLDLFCGAGGASTGYSRAGFDVVGVDIAAQPRYPYSFSRNDALDVLRSMLGYPTASGIWWNSGYFQAIHASPPCQAYSVTRNVWKRAHPDLVAPVRELLDELGLPYVIENVVGAPLRSPYMLCGSSFGLGAAGRHLRRHRLFETTFPMMVPTCNHFGVGAIGVYGGGSTRRTGTRRGGVTGTSAQARQALGNVDWMTREERNQCVPPAMTEYIGGYLLAHLASELARASHSQGQDPS